MGGWNLQLFGCDLDLQIIYELSETCGLWALEAKHGKQQAPLNTPEEGKAHRQGQHDMMAKTRLAEDTTLHLFPKASRKDSKICFSVLAALCTHPDYVRQHLDATGSFHNEMTSLRAQCKSAEARADRIGGIRDPYSYGYMMCLLGACGMTLGVNINKDEREAMQKYYKDCGLMRDAVTQLGDALEEDTGYVSGVQWDFGSLGLQDTLAAGAAPKEDLIFPGLMYNTWAPDHGRLPDEMEQFRSLAMTVIAQNIAQGRPPSVDDVATTLASLAFRPKDDPRTAICSTKADIRPELFRNEAATLLAVLGGGKNITVKHGDDVCGGCGSKKKADGSPLLACSKCQKRHYCSAQCQKTEWKEHKKTCQVPKQENVSVSSGLIG
ncbi:Putative Zinc finger, MYND-type [Septoria linicola]|uniref:Zinc finger, MYND-type n=1 Tax=Septoria linicola TaxID=215465 RepID=A0A9Q9ATF1_9PEZI|nr:putative Zinc finger, MYND-type [Septoria linicola]USW52853.1 Putative Zinc finger, MYND-type [Septoria linicola]